MRKLLIRNLVLLQVEEISAAISHKKAADVSSTVALNTLGCVWTQLVTLAGHPDTG